ncbi:UvrD-helicase domain-containing protein [Dermatophilaceae bacterium Soc4.6]
MSVVHEDRQATPLRVLSAHEISAAVDNPPPTDEQRAVIEAPADRPLLVVAGAGSGKTETMASRVVWLVANGHVEPDQVLGLTFTRKAASELAERIGRRLARLESSGLWTPRALDDDGAEALGGIPVVSTYHSYAGRLVREHALRLGYEPESRLLSEAAAWQYAAEAVARYDGPVDEVTSAESTIISSVTSLAGEMAEHLLEPEDVIALIDEVEDRWLAVPKGKNQLRIHPLRVPLDALVNRRAILPMVRAYLDLKRSRDALDFSDQMALAARLARDVPSVGALERQRFRAVLLDEFQDTSRAQMVLLSHLYAAAGSGIGVTAVGDPNQSIYGWRGASATTLADFRQQFPDPEAPDGLAREAQLSTSWRNDRAVLDAANVVSAPLRDESRVRVAALRPRPGAGPGDIEVGRFDRVDDEAEHLAAWIAAKWRRPSGTRTRETAAVLCRKRSQFPLVVEALRRHDLPVEVVGLGGLLLTPEVSDLVSLLWVVQDPSRGDRLMRLLTGPLCRLGAADLDGLATWARAQQREPRGLYVVPLPGLEPVEPVVQFDDPREEASDSRDADESGMAVLPPDDVVRDQAPESSERASIVEALDDLPGQEWRGPDGQQISPSGLGRLRELGLVLRGLRALTALPLADLVGEAERSIGLDIEVLARPEHTPTTARAHLDAFADVAAQFSMQADRPTLLGFLAWIDAAVDQERGLDTPTSESNVDAVQVLTVHAAKGLEWDHVAVPGLVEGSFPAREHGATSKVVDGEWVVGEHHDKGWLVGADGVPYPLRGDRDGLPHLSWAADADWKDLQEAFAQFQVEGGRHALAEERRLAYVAFTRARASMLLTAPVWSDGQSPRVTSTFLLELLDPESGLPVRRVAWADMPPVEGDKPVNPRTAEPVQHEWPHDPLAARRAELADAVARVGLTLQALETVVSGEATEAGDAGGATGIVDAETERELTLLLRERDGRRRPGEPVVDLPRHLSASAVVQLATDSARYASQLRRPMPSEPAHAARRGTAFHAWVEEHYASAAMVDVFDLPGSADDDAGDDAELPAMKAQFLASEWADRVPEAIETSVETVVDGIAIRGRLDAVFPRDDGGYTVVDWKTGAKPSTGEAKHRALQLGAYALAYARLRGLPAAKVDAAFYYAGTGETVRPRLPRERDLVTLLQRVQGTT